MNNIVLIRHTRIAVAPGICYGQTDVPLAPTFADETAALFTRLPWQPTRVWSSPATRCLRLAKRLARDDAFIRTDARLLELNFGEWENRAWESFRSPQSEAWALDPWNIRPPGGETAAEFHKRIGEIRAELNSIILTYAPPLRVAIITHAGVIRSWRAHARKIPLMALFSEPIPYGHIEHY